MALSTTVSLARMAFQIAGLRAPGVLARYAQLAYLNRTSRGRPIRKVPRPAATSTHRVLGRAAPWDADIVIPVYNDFDGIQGLLEVLRDEAAQFANMILVHDCSPDARVSPLLKNFRDNVPNASLMENEANLGFVQTCNRGLLASERDAIILNTDIELPPGGLGRLCDVLQAADDIATVTPFSSSAYGAGFPDLNYSNPRPFGATTEQVDRAFQAVGVLMPIEIPRGVGFCMAISRRVIDKIGVFDVAFGQGYGEEADFCLRARRLGFRNVIGPNVYVYHRAGQSFGGAAQQKARAGLVRVLERHPDYARSVRIYQEEAEARAVNLIALVALLQETSGLPVVLSRAPNPAGLQQDFPTLHVEEGSLVAELSFGGEVYRFAFAEPGVASEVFNLAGLST